MVKIVLPILIIICIFAGVGLADETLTITLDPQGDPQKQQSDLRLNHETLGATRTESQKQYQAQVKTPTTSSKKEAPIGRVGIVSASKADIRSYPGSKGKILYTCPKDTCLAILGYNGDWYGILMVDSSTGWIEKSKVTLLDYQVLGPTSKGGSSSSSKIINTALKYLGIPYKWGGYSFNGLDCSGFVKAVFASHGIKLPRTAREQAQVGAPVGWNQLQPGDRLYFACKGGAVDHAGIYMGNGLFIHSSVSRHGVAVDSVLKPYYMNSLVAARRS